MSFPNSLLLPVSDGTTLHAYVAHPPQANDPVPGILLLQEVFGVNSYIRSVADRLAQAGYVVVAPELFHRTAAPGLEIAYNDFASAMPHAHALTVEGLVADVRAVYTWLTTQPEVAAGKIGSIGFCLGGRVAFLANAELPLTAAVSYYGGGLPTLKDRAADLSGPHLFFWGGLDQHIPQADAVEIVAAVAAAGKPYINTVISYADHGFFCDQRPSYNADASREAWTLTLTFFANKFQD